MPQVLTEGRHATEGLLSEAEFHRSRDTATVVAGSGKIAPGTVLGVVTASGKYKPSPASGSDGSETAAAIAIYGCDATSADQKIAIIARSAQWKVGDLVFDSTVNDGPKRVAKINQLKAKGIIAR